MAKTQLDKEIMRICAERMVKPDQEADRILLKRIYNEEAQKGLFVPIFNKNFVRRNEMTHGKQN